MYDKAAFVHKGDIVNIPLELTCLNGMESFERKLE